MTAGHREELGADRVALCGEARPGEGLEEDAVEREGEQRGIVQSPRQGLGFACGLARGFEGGARGVGAAALRGDGGEEPGPQIGGAVRAEPEEGVPGRGDDGT